jgi:hypothetical protein
MKLAWITIAGAALPTQTIYHSAKYPSYIFLPVIPSPKIASK